MKKMLALLLAGTFCFNFLFAQTETLQSVTNNGSSTTNAIKITGTNNMPNGSGMELSYYDNAAYLSSYNRTASVYRPFYFAGSSFSFAQGNVGIGSAATPSFKLDVRGTTSFGGSYGNIDGASLTSLQNTGQVMVGWNRSGGRGETDFISNRGGGSEGGFMFYDYSNSGSLTELLSLKGNGNVGIGVTSPAYKLDVNGGGRFQSSLIVNGMNVNSNTTKLHVINSNASGKDWVLSSGLNMMNESHLGIYNASEDPSFSNPLVIIAPSGDLSVTGNQFIGNTASPKDLFVNGNIKTRKIKVTQTDWADYVFDSSYQLSSLHEVEKYIQANRHLPDVPSAAEVKREGLDLADNQVVLLKKIEELTLYIIRQNKEMMQQNSEIQEMKRMMKEMQAAKR